MAEVTLHTLWLNDTADLSDSMSFPYLRQLKVTPAMQGEVRRYANGARRVITRVGLATPLAVTLPACTREQLAWIEEHTGRVVMARDDRGRKIFGVYLEHSVDEHAYDDEGDVSLTIDPVSYDEAV